MNKSAENSFYTGLRGSNAAKAIRDADPERKAALALANYYKISTTLSNNVRITDALTAKAKELAALQREAELAYRNALEKNTVTNGKKAAQMVFYDPDLYGYIMTIMKTDEPPEDFHKYSMYKQVSGSKPESGFFVRTEPSYVLLVTTQLTDQSVVLTIRVNPGYETATNFDELLPFLEFSPMQDSYRDPNVWISGPDYKKLQNSSTVNYVQPLITGSAGLQGGRTKKYNKSKRSKRTRKQKQTRRRKRRGGRRAKNRINANPLFGR